MSVNTIPEDRPATDEHLKSDEFSNWNRAVLEYEEEENKRNPLPSIGGPVIRDRRAYVPEDVKKYLENRYGSGIEVNVGSSFGKEDRSGFSYLVHLREGEGVVRLAEMSTERKIIHILPPNYNGYLKAEKQKIEERNELLTKDSRPEELERTLWVINESPRAQEMHKAQL